MINLFDCFEETGAFDSVETKPPSSSLVSVVSVRLVREKEVSYGTDAKFNSPNDVVSFLNSTFEMKSLTKEIVVVLYVNTKNKIIGVQKMYEGTINSCTVSPRDIAQTALLLNAHACILSHNHPSGDTTPSKEDIDITRKVKEGLSYLDIHLLDHIIIGDCSYTSLKDKRII